MKVIQASFLMIFTTLLALLLLNNSIRKAEPIILYFSKGSSGIMEAETARVLWRRLDGTSFATLQCQMGTSTELSSIKPYGEEVEIDEDRCINHVGKWLGSALPCCR